MFYLMAEINGVLRRVGRHMKNETTAVSAALNKFQSGVRYVEVLREGKVVWCTAGL